MIRIAFKEGYDGGSAADRAYELAVAALRSLRRADVLPGLQYNANAFTRTIEIKDDDYEVIVATRPRHEVRRPEPPPHVRGLRD